MTSVEQKKLALQKSGKLASFPKVSKKGLALTLTNPGTKAITRLQASELKQLLGKSQYPIYLDFAPAVYNLEDDQLFSTCPNVVKEIDFSNNSISEIIHIGHLTKLKRLTVENNLVRKVTFAGLQSVEFISLAQNRLESLESMADLKKLVYLDLSGNRLATGFSEFIHLKSLKTLDLSMNAIDLPINEFYRFILSPLSKLPKLEFLSLAGNPVEDKIKEFRLFVIHELNRLKFYNWDHVTKDDLAQSNKLDESGVWDAHLQPVKPTSLAEHSDFVPGPNLEENNNKKPAFLSESLSQKNQIHQYLGKKEPQNEPNATPNLSTFRLFGNKLEDILQEFTDKKSASPSLNNNNLRPSALASSGSGSTTNPEQRLFGTHRIGMGGGLRASSPHNPASEPLVIPPLPSFPLGLASAFIPAAFDPSVDEAIRGFAPPSEAGPDLHSDTLLKLLDEIDLAARSQSFSATTAPTVALTPSVSVSGGDYIDLLDKLVGSDISDNSTSPLNISTIEKAIGSEGSKYGTLRDSARENASAASALLQYNKKLGESHDLGELWLATWQSRYVTARKHGMTGSKLAEKVYKLPLHENIVGYLQADTLGPKLTLSGWTEGIPLALLLKERWGLDSLGVDVMVNISKGLIGGLHFLHEHQVVHGGLHVDNVIIKSLPGPFENPLNVKEHQIKLRDFGWSRSLSTCPRDDMFDSFCFGTVMYQLFHGLAFWPFSDNLIVPGQEESLAINEEECPPLFMKLIDSCWSPEPELRPDSGKIYKILARPFDELVKYLAKPVSSRGLSRVPSMNNSTAPVVSEEAQKLAAVIAKVAELLTTDNDISQIRGLNGLQALVCDANVPAMINSPIMGHVLPLAQSSAREVQFSALSTLISLADFPEFCWKMKEEKIEWMIHFLLTQSDDEELLVVVTRLITKLAKEQTNLINLMQVGILSPLISLLKIENEMLQMQSVWAISCVLQNNELAQNEFQDIGGMSPLFKLLLSHNDALQIRTLTALSYFIGNARAQERILKAGVIGRFLDLLTIPTPLLQLLATKTLAAFAEHETYLSEMLSNRYVCPSLLRLIGTDSKELGEAKFYALRALYLLSSAHPQGLANLKQVGGIDIICQQLGNVREDVKIKCLAFICLFSEDEENMQLLRNLHVLESLVMLLSSIPISHDTLLINTLVTIEPIVFDEKNWKVMIQCCKPLLHILTGANNAEVRRRATKVLSELLRDDAAKEMIVAADGIGIFIDSLANTQDEETLESTVFALSFLSDSKNIRGALVQNGIFEKSFMLMRKPGLMLVKERILWTIANLATDPTNHFVIVQNLTQLLSVFVDAKELTVQSLCLKVLLILCNQPASKQQLNREQVLLALATFVPANKVAEQAAAKINVLLQ